MVNWEDGVLVTPAKVNTDGTITPAVYSGNTPLSAYNLNKMQSDLQEDADNKIENLSKTYKNSNIVGTTCEGFGKIHKLFGKTEETGEGEKSPSNPYELKCVADNINLFDKDKLQIASTWQCNCTVDSNKKISIKPTVASGVAFAKTNALNLKANTYTFSAKTEGQLSRIRILNSSDVELASSESNNFTFTLETDTAINVLFYVNNIALTNYLNIENIQIEESTEATAYREYGEGLIKITSTDGTNTSNKVISCKPLCCLKDTENNIIAQDYIDFDRQKIHRECGYINSYNSENITTNYISSTGSLTAGATIVYQLSQAIEEDIDITNRIVQYQNQTTISNSDNAEMEIELTNNKAISSINKNIVELQDSTNKLKEIYSTEERVVGKWIDGKKLYRKVMLINNSNEDYQTIPHNISNISEIIRIDGAAFSATGNTLPIPTIYIDNSTSAKDINYFTVNINLTNIVIIKQLVNILSVKVIFEYTKTTD